MSGAGAVHKQSLADVPQNRCQGCNFITKRLQHRCFPTKCTKSLRIPFLQNTSTLMAASGSVNQLRHILKVYPADRRNDISERYFSSKVRVSR